MNGVVLVSICTVVPKLQLLLMMVKLSIVILVVAVVKLALVMRNGRLLC